MLKMIIRMDDDKINIEKKIPSGWNIQNDRQYLRQNGLPAHGGFVRLFSVPG